MEIGEKGVNRGKERTIEEMCKKVSRPTREQCENKLQSTELLQSSKTDRQAAGTCRAAHHALQECLQRR